MQNSNTLNSDTVLYQTMKTNASTTLERTNENTINMGMEERVVVYGYLRGTNDTHHVLEKNKIIIGKDPDRCDIVLHNGKTISPEHARIEFRKTSTSYTCIITDLQSQNGTLVNDKRLFLDSVTKQLHHGDKIRFGFDQTFYTIELLYEEEKPNKNSTDERGFVGILNPDFKPGKVNQNRRSKSVDKAMSRPRVEPSKEYKEKLDKQQQEFKSLLEKRRSEKKRAEKDPSTITFQTASGAKTVSMDDLVEESEEESGVEDQFDPQQETTTTQLRDANQQEGSAATNSHPNREQALRPRADQMSMPTTNFDILSERIGTIEKTIQNEQRNEEQEFYHFNILVNSAHLMSHKLLNELGEVKSSPEDFLNNSTLNEQSSKSVREILIGKLKDVKSVLSTCIGKVNDREKEKTKKDNFKSQALERYATELQIELDTVRFEYERKNMLVEELKRQSVVDHRKKDEDTIKTLRECLEFKDSEMRDLQSQLASNSLIGYNSEAAKSRMQNLVSTLMKDMEEYKRRNMESQHRLEKRLMEWQQVNDENKKLRYRVSDLQETIHRQMNDLHISLMHKEQKLNSWKSKVAELASDNNEMRYRAASFLLSLASEQDSRDTETLLKYEEVKRNLHFSQMENNELRLEIQNLKDVLQYTDVNSTRQTMDMLKDKIHQMEIECSVDRVLEYQNTIVNLSSKVSEYERMQGLYLQEFSRLKKLNIKFNEGACIGTLERKIQLYEKKVESLAKQLDQAMVERESAISPILQSQQVQQIHSQLNAIQRVDLKESSPITVVPKPNLSRTSSRRSSKGDLRSAITLDQQHEPVNSTSELMNQEEENLTLPKLEKKSSKTNVIEQLVVNNNHNTEQDQ